MFKNLRGYKQYNLGLTYQKEFIIPKKFQTKSINLNSCKLNISSNILKKNNNFNSFFNIKKKTENFVHTINKNLEINYARSLFTNLNSESKPIQIESKTYPEIEYGLSFKYKNKVIKGSFLFNPLPVRKKLLDQQKLNYYKFKCIDYLFTRECCGGLYLLSNNILDLIKDENRFVEITMFEKNQLSKKQKYLLPKKNNAIFVDYSFISPEITHFVITSPLTWITFSINIIKNSLSLEHTLAPHYFIKK